MHRIDLSDENKFEKRFPLSIVAILAVVQMVSTFAIIATEIGHNLLHVKSTNLFVGFWTSVPFTILWISMFSVVCCCRRKTCATHAFVQNLLALFFAVILIVLNVRFVREPNRCFFPEGICQKLTWIDSLSEPIECLVDGLPDHCGNTRISLIVSQIVAAICLALSCAVYLFIYSWIIFRKKTNLSPIDPIVSSKKTTMPMTISHHHHSYTISSHPYSTLSPLFIPVYPPALPNNDGHYVNCISPNLYSSIAQERF